MPRLRKAKEHTRHPYKKGLTLPGYNYLGPFNGLRNGPPTNPSDAAAQRHDKSYAEIAKTHGAITPYIKYNDADETFVNEARDDWGGRLGKSFFRIKKRLAGRLESDPKRAKTSPNGMPFSNSPPNTPTTRMSGSGDGEGSGNPKGTKETPVDEIVNVTRGPPNYTFASLPFYYDRICTVTQWSDEWAFRMTSPYDCSVAVALTDLNAGAGTAQVITQAADGGDGSAQNARWYTMYAGLYNYYHVVSCKWTMMIENLSTEGIWCHQMYHNDTQPPTGASNQDMLHWPDCKSHYIGPIGHAITSAGVREHNEMVDDMENYEPSTQGPAGIVPNYESTNHISARGQSNIIEFGGSYAPGDFNREIHLDSEVENWTAVTTNPTLTERCMFRIRPQWDTIGTNNTGVYDRPLSYRFIYRCDYLVEFKELKDGLRWPINRQPITISIQNSVGAE